ncbi:hypothetical protein GCM10010467_27070 [Actinocorallia glomerata]|uniref:Uncharacterized protein n=2 Tax=Actinomycetes TaxID=1760 RepID=A0ABP6LQQ9_9MICC
MAAPPGAHELSTSAAGASSIAVFRRPAGDADQGRIQLRAGADGPVYEPVPGRARSEARDDARNVAGDEAELMEDTLAEDCGLRMQRRCHGLSQFWHILERRRPIRCTSTAGRRVGA